MRDVVNVVLARQQEADDEPEFEIDLGSQLPEGMY